MLPIVLHNLYRMLKIIISLLLVCIVYTQDPDLGQWRWAEDTMQPTDDKQVHAVGSFGLYYLLVCKEVPKSYAIGITVGLGLAKESIDAIVPWETYGRWGGDGFSLNDIKYNILGVGIAYTLDKIWSSPNITFEQNSFKIIYNLP